MRTQTGRNRSPWNEPECGQLYSRAMAHWNLYDQACGASFDSTQAALSFDPRFTQAVSGGERAFHCLFLAENGWGEFKQSGPAGLPSGTVSLSAAWGTVKLKSLKIVSTAKGVAARVGASAINAAIDGGVVSFADGLTLTTGSTATITLTGGSGSQDADSVAVPIPGTTPGNSSSSLRQRRCAGEDAECCPSGNRCGTEEVKAPARRHGGGWKAAVASLLLALAMFVLGSLCGPRLTGFVHGAQE